MKFIHNLLVAIHNCSAGEAFALGIKAGIDPQVVYDVISSSAGTSRMFEVLRGWAAVTTLGVVLSTIGFGLWGGSQLLGRRADLVAADRKPDAG